MGAWLTVVAFPSRSRSSFDCNHPRQQLEQYHHPSPSTPPPTPPSKGPNTGYFPEDQASQREVFKSDTVFRPNHTTLTRSPTASRVRHQGRLKGRCADDMPSKTPHTNGNDPVENGINGTKDIEMKDDAPAPLKGGKGKKAKDGDEEMTVVVPPSKGSKLSAPLKKDNEGDVAMGEEETNGEDGAVKVDPVAKAVSGMWIVTLSLFVLSDDPSTDNFISVQISRARFHYWNARLRCSMLGLPSELCVQSPRSANA